MAHNLQNLNERPLAFTDLETTGDVFGVHEILEIGLVVVSQKDFEVLEELNIKTKPLHMENAVPAALDKNGYRAEDWAEALPLKKTIEQYAEKTKGAIFVAYNATFDWGFMNQAFRETGVEDKMDYHRLDVLSMAWLKLRERGLDRWGLSKVAAYLGIPEEPLPHRAINGARLALEVYKKLLEV